MTNTTSSKALSSALWISQALIALLFIMPGFMKMFQSIESLGAMLPWAGQVSPLVVRLLGFIDLLAGVGIIAPSIFKVRAKLTIYAAYGGILLMFSAIVFHLVRGEASVIGFNFVIVAVLAFIAWGRSKRVIISAR